MRIRLFVPSIAGLPTGGNVYNDLLERSLHAFAAVDRVAAHTLQPEGGPETVWLVDSLLFREELGSLRRAGPDAILVGLIHYLHLIDPRFASAETAREEHRLLPLLDAFITTSAYSARALAGSGVAPDRILVAEPGLENAFRNRTVRRRNDRPIEILTVASLVPDKGLEDVAQALTRLSNPNWHWTLAGSNRLNTEFARALLPEIQSTVGSDRFTFLGEQDQAELADRYRIADLFVLCSRFESCGMVVREAMAAGLAVVAYRVGGLSEQIRSENEGVLVDAGAIDQVTRSLEALIGDFHLRHAMGEAAAKRAAEFPTWAETGSQVRDFLARISGHSAG